MAVSSAVPHTAARMVREYEVDVFRRSVRVRLSGALTSDALRSTFIDAHDDPRITADFVVLIDLRDVKSADRLSSGDIRILAESRLGPVARRAFVAHDPAVFGLCRMFASLREVVEGSEPVGVFRSVRSAEEWLGLLA